MRKEESSLERIRRKTPTIFSIDPEDVVKRRITTVFGYDMRGECVSGTVNILNWRALLPALHVSNTIVPAYLIILVMRRRIVARLCSQSTMSRSTKRLQTQLLKAITCHAVIPVFYSLAVIMYSLGQLDILYHPFLEYFSLIMAHFIPMLTPLASLYFIQPYRMWISKNLTIFSTIRSSIAPESFITSVA
ncbi:unnamed protein product [Strongylus vulgaris]|uniref:G-protein coupled receptors family 1 profile domain-containing protein n=1 Tax=Strongylus vulgaris TaxID=40348 RepID=A0A3P7IFQ2_STRVU|nr:unnamed protein product [Strongylus vulgaris]